MHATEAALRSLLPDAPTTEAETGLSHDVIVQLLLKTLHFSGDLSGADCARRLGVKFSVLEPSLNDIRGRRYCEVIGGGVVGSSSFLYRVSEAGRAAAVAFLQHNRYVGPLPVPLPDYRQYMDSVATVIAAPISRARIEDAFSHLVLGSTILEELGPAINAGQSIFIYGPPGNGKTVIARAICDLMNGEMAIPHALFVEGAIVRVFDPAMHEPLPDDRVSDIGLETTEQYDRRWARCRRPRIATGGELMLQSLELSYGGGVYRAPIQVMANGGVLLVDDFGRQRCSPRDLLDRWMVPLEDRVDFLTLQSGLRIEVPFATMIVFATNLRPADLVEEAFLRRVQFKVSAVDPSPDGFLRIFERCCADRNLPFEPWIVTDLIDRWYRPRGIPTRACHPRDLINQALLIAEYLELPRTLTPKLLEKACLAYFVIDREPGRPAS